MSKPLSVRWLLVVIFCCITPCALGQTPEVAPAVLKPHIDKLKSPERETRIEAAIEIGKMGPAAKEAVPSLIEMLNGSDPVERMAAAMALARIGPEAKEAIPALEEAAKSGNDRLAAVANSAIRTIQPPVSAKMMNFVSSPYVLASLLALGGGLVALFLLGWRRSGGVPDPVWKIEVDKRAKAALEKNRAAEKEASLEEAEKRLEKRPQKRPEKKSETDTEKKQVVDKTPTPPGEKKIEKKSEASLAAKSETPIDLHKPRTRVSRPLANLGAYVQEQVGSESAKRELIRAQEGLKAISEQQRSLAGYIENPELASDPERVRSLRKDIDQYAIEHYRGEVRVKALEVKMLEMLLAESKTSDAELRERSDAMLKQKWDELRTLCETPSKIVLRSEQWVTVPTGPKAPIEDLRAWLREHDVEFPERNPEESASA